jgi:GNAT superfamily N-acetyltransferase
MTRPPLLARTATTSDIDHLVPMIGGLFALENIPFHRERVSAGLTTLLGDASLGTAWVFSIDDDVVGYAIVSFGFDLEFGGRDAIMTDFFLVPDARNQGRGKEALERVVEGSRDQGVLALHLMVDPANKPAFKLYAGSKFEQSHRVMMTRWM